MIDLFPSRTIALELFGFSVHWYGITYLLAFVIAWYLLPRLQKFRDLSLSQDEWAGLLSAAVLGVLMGGRLGFVLFYQPSYYLSHPEEIIAVWRGGMSSHGGFIGVALALSYALRHRRSQMLRIADVITVPIAIGLALGRMGNFINQELYGTVTTLPWGIAIPGVEGLRHPTPIYAVLKDLCIAAVCFAHLYYDGSRSSGLGSRSSGLRQSKQSFIAGRTVAIFLMMYGVLRFLIEPLRVQDYFPLDLGIVMLTRGQLLTIPVFLIGSGLWWWTGRSTISR